ncbi:MAG TPA: YlxR family protein [Stenomitos sp.]
MEPNYRRCISCRVAGHKAQFLRVVREHLSGTITLNRGMGRSAYVCPTLDCIRLAQKKKRLERALKSPVPPTFYTLIEASLAHTQQNATPDSSIRDVS